MARFRVYRLQHDGALALDVQADLLSDLNTRTMVPLLARERLARIFPRLNPVFHIDGAAYIMATQFIGSISVGDLGDLVADLTPDADAITSATDFLFQGF